MSKVRPPIIGHQCFFTIEKIKKVPDGRYKSGYREIVTLAQQQVLLAPLMPTEGIEKVYNTEATLNHLDTRPQGVWQSLAHATINLKLTEVERRI